jgi:hypothetical protein
MCLLYLSFQQPYSIPHSDPVVNNFLGDVIEALDFPDRKFYAAPMGYANAFDILKRPTFPR